MLQNIKEKLRRHIFGHRLLVFMQKIHIWLKFLKRIQSRRIQLLKQSILRKSNLPSTIQLPITYKCNFNCVMCGMHNLIGQKDFNSEELRTILKDKLYSRVTAVGINGGEPFLKTDLLDCINAIVNMLPSLKSLNIISNGFFTDKIISQLTEIKKLCKLKSIKVNLSLSVDGVKDMQDFMRGHKDAFTHVNQTIQNFAILLESSVH